MCYYFGYSIFMSLVHIDYTCSLVFPRTRCLHEARGTHWGTSPGRWSKGDYSRDFRSRRSTSEVHQDVLLLKDISLEPQLQKFSPTISTCFKVASFRTGDDSYIREPVCAHYRDMRITQSMKEHQTTIGWVLLPNQGG